MAGAGKSSVVFGPFLSRRPIHILFICWLQLGLTLIVVTSAFLHSFSMLSLCDKRICACCAFIGEPRNGKLFPELWGLAVKNQLPPSSPGKCNKHNGPPRCVSEIKSLLFDSLWYLDKKILIKCHL